MNQNSTPRLCRREYYSYIHTHANRQLKNHSRSSRLDGSTAANVKNWIQICRNAHVMHTTPAMKIHPRWWQRTCKHGIWREHVVWGLFMTRFINLLIIIIIMTTRRITDLHLHQDTKAVVTPHTTATKTLKQWSHLTPLTPRRLATVILQQQQTAVAEFAPGLCSFALFTQSCAKSA